MPATAADIDAPRTLADAVIPGTLFSGSSPDQSKSVTVVMFTQGKAFATLEFDGAPNDPVAVDFANDVGQKQDAAVKAGLPS
jgi:hypothetical protein